MIDSFVLRQNNEYICTNGFACAGDCVCYSLIVSGALMTLRFEKFCSCIFVDFDFRCFCCDYLEWYVQNDILFGLIYECMMAEK